MNNEREIKCLDDVIAANRDEFKLRLATAHEIASISSMLIDDSRVRRIKDGQLSNYSVIRLHDESQGIFFVAGYRSEHRLLKPHPIVTSDVLALTDDVAITRNSIYRLGDRNLNEPDLYLLGHLIGTLNRWGFGDALGLPPLGD